MDLTGPGMSATARRAHRASGSCPTPTNAPVPTRRCGRTSPRKQPRRLRPVCSPAKGRSGAAEIRRRNSSSRRPTGRSARQASGRPTVRRNLITAAAIFWPADGRDAEIAAAIGRARETEPTISSDVRAVEQENRYGGWLEGFDRRLKDEDRLQEKVAAKLRFQPDREAVEIIEEIPDAIRYTFCLRLETYTAGYYDIMRRLEDRGYEMYYSKNWWTNPEYKGINTRWVTPEGQRFEVQFHTPESFHTKQNVTHPAYERIRSRLVADEERTGLKAFQREAASRIQVPAGASDVSDYKKKGF